ncbi:Uma2 family endonuclease [Fervidibacter sacchari]|uniref:Uma2 family endonuclease n=1 Tax=Candidatus Fervidibacter sacchari TaxID=1448929 RepID=A0ABT2EL65_9BACT|nr:Uma2 family endonuclease [Candidatus Fervidibacter sacchari]MCS3918679.1 Uma2 family endonuclease [Candidatus Fervidibacter sacchari]WKU17564.1 Uma2 family endonuclease [Candidatus Fervidibacter sacchari]
MAITEISAKRKISLAEFLSLPEDDSSPVKYELEFGELVEVTRPTWEHNELIFALGALLQQYVRSRRLGRVSGDVLVILDEAKDLAYAPDIVFVATENLERIREGKVYGPPDLVVEVLSPTTMQRDVGKKKRIYHAYGVQWYWVVDMERQVIEEYRWTPEGYLLTQVVLPDETFRPKLFPELEINLRALMGLEEETKSPKKRRR